MTTPRDEQRERFAEVLTAWSIDDLRSCPPHGWRCDYRKSDGTLVYDPCNCVSDILDELQAAARLEQP